jgi:hypothetical protein
MAVVRQYSFSGDADRKVNLKNMLTFTLSAGRDGLRKLVVVSVSDGGAVGCWLC